jgi:hypothetical protein
VALMDYPCYGCARHAAADPRPWLLITAWRTVEDPRVPFSAMVCPDCEQSTARLANELHDLIGLRLPDNSDSSIRTALRGWPTGPQTE